MHVDLSRKEIAQLFFETHSGSMVRMFEAFIEEEDAEDRAEMLQRLAQMDERPDSA
jgi:DNA-binding SARP family transcriptional activator